MREKLKQFGVLVIIIGIVCVVMGVGGIIDNRKTPVAFEDLKVSQLKPGMIVDGNISFNLGAFEESYDTKYGIKTGSSQYYYAVMVEDKVMAVETVEGGTVSNALEKQSEDFWSYAEGEGDDLSLSSGIAIKGKVKKMDSETQDYLKDYLSYGGEMFFEISPYVIDIGVMDMTSSMVVTGIGVLCIIIPLLIMLAGMKAASRNSYGGSYNQGGYGSTDTSYDSTSGSYDTGATSTGSTSFGQDFEEYERSLKDSDNY